MTDYQIFFLIVAVFVVAYLLGKREGKDDGERAARGDAAQRRWEEEQRKKEEERKKVHYAPRDATRDAERQKYLDNAHIHGWPRDDVNKWRELGQQDIRNESEANPGSK